jgi:hypothetical protein
VLDNRRKNFLLSKHKLKKLLLSEQRLGDFDAGIVKIKNMLLLSKTHITVTEISFVGQ